MDELGGITSMKHRRRLTAEQKRVMVEEAGQPGMSVSAVARKHKVHPNQLFKWKRLLRQGTLCSQRPGQEVVPLSEVKELKARITDLERALGRKTLEVETLIHALETARETDGSAANPCRTKILCSRGGSYE